VAERRRRGIWSGDGLARPRGGAASEWVVELSARAVPQGPFAAWAAVRLGGRRACEELGAWEDVGCGWRKDWGVVAQSGSRRVERVGHLSAQIALYVSLISHWLIGS